MIKRDKPFLDSLNNLVFEAAKRQGSLEAHELPKDKELGFLKDLA